MAPIHVLAGLTLLLLSVYHLVRPLVTSVELDELRTDLISTFVLFGGVWAVVLFSGFFQLGSRGTVAPIILNKLGVTIGGGAVALVTALGFIRGGWPRLVYVIGQVLTVCLLGYALYGGFILT